MPGLRTLSATVAVRGGARWEDEARSGWSHFLEHLVFKGAGEMSAREIVERIEAEGGSINASTGYERTSFDVRGLDGSLPLALQVMSDLVFRPTLDPDEVEREKDVVAQEIAEAFDTPDDHVFEMAQTRAFASQALGRPILGSIASLAPATRADMADWRARLYAPDRMVVAVSGAVDEDELLRLAEEWFGSEPSAETEVPDAARFVGGEARLARRIEQANLVFQIPAVSAVDPAFPAARVFADILGGGMASRLFQSAREERGLAYAVDAYVEAYDDAGFIGVFAGAAADRATELAELCATEIRRLADEGPGEAELARSKMGFVAGHWMHEERPAARSATNAAQTLIHGAPVSAEDSVARIQALTRDEVVEVGGRMLASGLSATAVLGPRAAAGAGAAFGRSLASG
ncbi:M16 family metallopeptidase [Brevundimonas sp. VNH65]|uniref:M16 family metallopeptidase n=1 Tax=Brevundimonas sp. VNH65 TaxID=3400917 RepID=UPI003C0C70D5